MTFGWYPTGLNSGHELRGQLPARGRRLSRHAAGPSWRGCRASSTSSTAPTCAPATMYPAMARDLPRGRRAVRRDVRLRHAADRLAQPRLADPLPEPGLHAAEGDERGHRRRGDAPPAAHGGRYGRIRATPSSATSADLHEDDLGELVARDAFLYAGSTRSHACPSLAALRRIAGYGSSPVVTLRGRGDLLPGPGPPRRLAAGGLPRRGAGARPLRAARRDKIVTRAIRRAWPMTVALADLGDDVHGPAHRRGQPRAPRGPRAAASPCARRLRPERAPARSTAPRSRSGSATIGFAEYHAPPADTLPLAVVPLGRAGATSPAATPSVRARVVDVTAPDSVVLFRPAGRPAGSARFADAAGRRVRLRAPPFPPTRCARGRTSYVVTVRRGDSSAHLPRRRQRGARPTGTSTAGRAGGRCGRAPRSPLRLFDPGAGRARLAFTRIGDAGRRGLFRLGLSERHRASRSFHLALPVDSSGWSPPDYTASLVIAGPDRERGGRRSPARARVRLRLRGLGPRQVLHLTLMEEDGTSWSAAVPVDSAWSERALPLADFRAGRGVMLPQGFPGEWNYWVGPGGRSRRERGTGRGSSTSSGCSSRCGARRARRCGRTATASRWSR